MEERSGERAKGRAEERAVPSGTLAQGAPAGGAAAAGCGGGSQLPMAEKLRLIKSELALHPDTPMLTTLKGANEAMGLVAEGPIPVQAGPLT